MEYDDEGSVTVHTLISTCIPQWLDPHLGDATIAVTHTDQRCVDR